MGKKNKGGRNNSVEAAEGFSAGPGEFSVQVISGATSDSAPAVVVSTKTERWLVNAGAGVQRLCTEHRVRAVKLTAVLCTHVNSDSVGGLPGLAMTAADGGRPTFHCIGPPGLRAVERASRPFCRRDFFAQRIDEVSVPAGATSAEVSYPGSVTVVAAAVRPLATAAAEATVTDDNDSKDRFLHSSEKLAETNEPDPKRSRIDPDSSAQAMPMPPLPPDLSLPDPKSSQNAAKPPPPATVDVSFIFRVPGQRGKFDATAAAALGVPKGRLCGDLHAGRSVTLPDGVTVVHPHQVVGASKPPLAVAALQCSSLAHLPCLMEHPAVAKLLSPLPSNDDSSTGGSSGGDVSGGSGSSSNDHCGVPLAVHLADKSVVESPAYRAFLARFSPTTRHWLVAHEAPVAMAGVDARLNAGADADPQRQVALVATAPAAAADASGNGSGSSNSSGAIGEQQPPWLLPGGRIPVASPYRASSLATLRLGHLLPDLFPLSRKVTQSATTGGGASLEIASASSGANASVVAALPRNCSGVLPLLRFVVEPARCAGEVWDEVKGPIAQGEEASREAALWERALELGVLKALATFRASAAGAAKEDENGVRDASHNTKESLVEAPAGIATSDAASREPATDAQSDETTVTSAAAAATTVVDPVASSFDPALDARGASALAAAGDNVRLTFLGTGSAAPSKHRNTSAIHLHIGGLPALPSSLSNGAGEGESSSLLGTTSRGLLFDCGEGTLGQMKRCWGAAECANVLMELEGIWVSHPHADHHLGIAEVLSARAAALTALKQKYHDTKEEEEHRRPPLVLMAPKSVGLWLEHWSRLDRSLDPVSYVLVNCTDLLPHLAPDLRAGSSTTSSSGGSGGGDESSSANGTSGSGLTTTTAASATAPATTAAPGAQSLGKPDEDLRWLGAAPGDEVRRCRDCNEHYLFTTGEQDFYQSKGFTSKPSRCADCRAAYRDAQADLQERQQQQVGASTTHDGISDSNQGSATTSSNGAASAVTQVTKTTGPLAPALGHTAVRQLLARLGLARIVNVRVPHCREAFGVRIDSLSSTASTTSPTTDPHNQHSGTSTNLEQHPKTKEAWSLCYSGDCRPSEALAELGRGATVCIHEASFGDDMQADAVSKRHSTVSEAVALSLGTMQVHRCVLTHFSQRYPKLPDLPLRVSSRVLVACDLLSVTLGQLKWAPEAVLPVLRCLCASSEDEEEVEEAGDNVATGAEKK